MTMAASRAVMALAALHEGAQWRASRPVKTSLSAGEARRTLLHKGSRSLAQILGDEGAGLR
jgi:hypothetical protein